MMRPFDYLTLMQFAWAFLAIIGFSVRSNLKGIRVLFTGLGGGSLLGQLSDYPVLYKVDVAFCVPGDYLSMYILGSGGQKTTYASIGVCDLCDHPAGTRKEPLLCNAGLYQRSIDAGFKVHFRHPDDFGNHRYGNSNCCLSNKPDSAPASPLLIKET